MSNAALALEAGSPSGLVLGRYRPLKPLGSGGSGSVWLVCDEETGLDLALKIVAREGKAAARAEREAAAAARLRHPNCLRAYAFARDPRHVYIAYEFVPGRTMREAMRSGAFDDRSAIEACAQVCDALAHAHATGIVHRDVKPSNVQLVEGEDVSVRLLDFGLALMSGEETLTAQGDVPGTLAYISPERLAGDEATAASDVWGVGVMLWEALAGRHPFWQSSVLDTARAIETGAESLATLRPDLARALVELVDRSLSLSPARRPAAAELANRLRGAVAPRRKRRPRNPALAFPLAAPRAGAAALAGGFAAWAGLALPFFPTTWAVAVALVAAGTTLVRDRLGLALALAVPVLPLGNMSIGLALVYGGLAAAWLRISWRAPRSGLLFALGPVLALLGGLGLMPLAAGAVRSPMRRALHAGLAVLVAGVVAGFRHAGLPFTGAAAPLGAGVGAANDPFDVLGSLLRAATGQPVLLAEAAAFAVLAAVLPLAARRGRWGAAGFGAAMLAATILPAPSIHALPLVAAAWLTAGLLAWRGTSWTRLPVLRRG